MVVRFARDKRSENLLYLGNAMKLTAGEVSGDPAMDETWLDLWGNDPEKSIAEAARTAAAFIRSRNR